MIPKPTLPRRFVRATFAAAIVIVFTLSDALYTVPEGDFAVVTRFGRPVREIRDAGAYWKLPASIDQVRRISRRRNIFSTPETTSFTRDKKNIVLSTFVVWRVENPLTYLQAVGEIPSAEIHLTGMVLAAKAQVVGQQDLTALVSTREEEIQVGAMEDAMTQSVCMRARSRLGIVVDKIGVERVAFPTENLSAVFDRMRVERQGEANRLRAEGQKAAQVLRDDAYVKSQEILRAGKEEAARITAQTERDIAEQQAAVYGRNPEFYRFWSSLQASKRALQERATLILSTDQLFFEELAEPHPEPSPRSWTPPPEPEATSAERRHP